MIELQHLQILSITVQNVEVGSMDVASAGQNVTQAVQDSFDRGLIGHSAGRTQQSSTAIFGRSVDVQWDELYVRILKPNPKSNTDKLLREDLRQRRGGYRIREEDRPKKIPLSTAQLLRRAEHAGPHIGKLCQLLYQQQEQTSIRRILGIFSLIKKYGITGVEDACAAAFDIGRVRAAFRFPCRRTRFNSSISLIFPWDTPFSRAVTPSQNGILRHRTISVQMSTKPGLTLRPD